MVSALLGLVLLLAGGWAAFAWGRPRADVPPAGWYPDPDGRGRFWDGQTWSDAVGPGGAREPRTQRRFWSTRWVLPAVAAIVVLAVGGWLWLATEAVPVLIVVSAVGMACVCAAFYRFVERRLDLQDVVTYREVAAITVAAAGGVLVTALPLNNAIVANFGLTTALATVGLVEEAAKLVVPLGLYVLGRCRNPRAGIAAGLAGGFGFAIAETATYAITLPLGGAPDPCTGAVLASPGPVGALVGQVFRIVLVSPLHWFWTGIVAAVVWRQWRLHGPSLNGPVVGAFALAVLTHSLNDSSAVWTCNAPPTALAIKGVATFATPVVLYLLFKLFASQSTPPQLVGVVSRGWQPHRLGTAPVPPP